MEFKETLRDLAKRTGIKIKTLQKRLDLKSFNMVEGEDFTRLGDRQSTLLSPSGVKKIMKEDVNMEGIQYLEDSTRKDLTMQEIKWFYSAAGVVINYICLHIKGFINKPEYRVATNSSMAHQGEKLKDYIISLNYKWLFGKVNDETKDIELFKKAMLNVIEYGHFNLNTSYYTEHFAEIYLFSCQAGNKFGINEEII